jgi:hypothetical protein
MTGHAGVLRDQIERPQFAEIRDHQLVSGECQQHASTLAVVIDIEDQTMVVTLDTARETVGRIG